MRKLTYLSGGVPGLLLSAGSGAVFLVGGMRVIDHSITMGTLVAFIAYQMRLVWPIQALMGLYASLASARVSLATRERDPRRATRRDRRRPTRWPFRRARGRVTLDDVTFSFGRGGARARRVSLVVARRTSVWPSLAEAAKGNRRSPICSSGSSTRRAGRVMLDGVDLRSIRLEDVRRHILVVDQEPFVFNATIAENIRYAQPSASDADVRAAAERRDSQPLIARLPRGIDDERG